MKNICPLISRTVGYSLLCSVILFANACSQPLAEVQTPVTLPQSFTIQGEQPLPDQWWLSLEDDQLNQLIEQALDQNLDLKMAWDRLALAQAQAKKIGAPLLPQLDGAAGIEREVRRSNGSRNTASTYSMSLTASYELDLWGKLRSARDAATYEAHASQYDVYTAAITLTSSVAQTWYQLIEQLGQIKLLDEQIKINEQVLELVESRFRRGQAAASDVLRQKALVESRRGDRILADNQVQIYKHQLSVLLGKLPNELDVTPPAEMITLSKLPQTGLPTDLIKRRPDVQSAFIGIMVADRNLAEAIADQYPTIGISLSAGSSAEHIRDLFDNWFANIAANLVAPLFDGGERKAEVLRQKALVSQALHTYHQAILDAITDVEDALVSEAHQAMYIDSLAKQLDLNQQAVSRIRDQYTKGGQDYLDVLDSLLDLQSTERELLSASQQMIQDRITLYRALSGSWQMDQPDILQINQSQQQAN
jgi:NodT family efflux transporter outer membrane factor (OMF) lipoprotein